MTKADKKRTPEWFRKCRERLGLTQERMAEQMGLSPNSVYRKERTDGAAVPVTDRDAKIVESMLRARNLPIPRG